MQKNIQNQFDKLDRLRHEEKAAMPMQAVEAEKSGQEEYKILYRAIHEKFREKIWRKFKKTLSEKTNNIEVKLDSEIAVNAEKLEVYENKIAVIDT